jgi:large subunit ribosomal protein L23
MSILDKFKGKEAKKEGAAKTEASLADEKTKTVQKPPVASKKKTDRKIVGVLVKPMITEKAAFIGQYGQYVFEVAPKANKIEIAKAVESIYGVKPASVNIIHVRGKHIRYGKTSGQTKKKKKAIVTLRPGEKIEVNEGV